MSAREFANVCRKSLRSAESLSESLRKVCQRVLSESLSVCQRVCKVSEGLRDYAKSAGRLSESLKVCQGLCRKSAGSLREVCGKCASKRDYLCKVRENQSK